MRKVNLFVPCFIDQFFPDIAEATVKILKKLGFEILLPRKQTCCGQPAFNSGYWKETQALAKKFLKDFDNEFPVVAPSASCTGFVKKHYEKILTDKKDLERFFNLKNRLFELTDFIVNELKINDLGAEFHHIVTYHDACSALREYGIKHEPRTLLAKVKGLKLVEMSEAETCCGFGGTFSVKMPHISTAIVEKKVRSALQTGAEFIVSTEASCLMNIDGYIKKQKLPVKTIHIAKILAS